MYVNVGQSVDLPLGSSLKYFNDDLMEDAEDESKLLLYKPLEFCSGNYLKLEQITVSA